MYRHLNILFIVILLLSGISAYGQSSVSQEALNKIEIGHLETLFSRVLQEERRIWIHLPSSYQQNPTDQQYPVLILLDARAHFTAMAAMANQLGRELFWPKMIIVGIESTDRFRDFTPSRIHPLNELPSTYFTNTGEASKFLEFITSELIPYIEKRYPASTYRSLLGHSLGGLFTTYAMLTGDAHFRNFIAIDPSVWWDDNYLLHQVAPYTSCLLAENASFHLVAANTLPDHVSIEDAPENKDERTAHFRAINTLNELLMQSKCSSDQYTFRYYERNSHANVAILAFYDTFSSIFDFYNIDPVLKSFDPDQLQNISTVQFLAAFREHYAIISKKLGYTISPEEDLIHSMGYKSMEMEDFEKAEALFRLNISNFPESSRNYDAMGDFYFNTHRLNQASQYYQRALELGGNDHIRGKLEYLKMHH